MKRTLGQRIRSRQPTSLHAYLVTTVPAPLQRATFRRLWLGMSMSYAGDRLQGIAQAWLVATVTGSALAVGWITALGSLPLLLIPVGGVVADQVDRSRLLITWQLVGAVATAAVATVFVLDRLAIWHVYAWAFVNGVIHLLSRPAYKVALTEVVPAEEVRPAVAINSMTETGAMVTVNAAGSVLLGLIGLPIAFLLNTLTYLVAAGALWNLNELRRLAVPQQRLEPGRILTDLRRGLTYLVQQAALWQPLLLTFVTIVTISPMFGLLAAIVHSQAGSIVDLGLLAAATSIGAFAGAAFAGVRGEGEVATRTYALWGIVAALALSVFAYWPVSLLAAIALAMSGFVAFSQAVWNTSRIRRLANERYQARLQAITSMAFTLGASVGALWAGMAVDWFGLVALHGGAALLAMLSLLALTVTSGWWGRVWRTQ